MALIRCPECKEQISDQAIVCPRCGHLRVTDSPSRGLRSFGFEWRSKQEIFGLPIVHVTLGFDKKTGRLAVSKGIIAIGQFGVGVITIAQFGIGVLAGIGQFMAGIIAIGQFAGGILFGLGQFATGVIVIAQFGVGYYVRALSGVGYYLWTKKVQDPVAVELFRNLVGLIKLKMG